MDRHDFISKIIAMYPHIIKDDGVDAYYDLYKRSFYGKNVNFEKLFDLFATEYKDKYPPSGAYLSELANKCLNEERTDANKWIQVRIYNPIYKCEQSTDCFPAGTSEQAILNTYKKMFGGDGWKILETY